MASNYNIFFDGETGDDTLFGDTVINTQEVPHCDVEIEMFKTACQKGDVSLVQSFINKGFAYAESGLVYACQHGHINVVKLLLNEPHCDFHTATVCALDHEYTNIVKLLVPKLADKEWNPQFIFGRSAAINNLDMIIWLVGQLPSFTFDFQEGLEVSLQFKHYHIAVWMLKHAHKPLDITRAIDKVDIADQSRIKAHLACNNILCN